MNNPTTMLTIGGSDSGGAAGIQADLKTMTALGGYGMSVITAVTAQNSVSVSGVQWMPPEFVTAQLDAVLSDYGADGVKTGFLGKADLITAVSQSLQTYRPNVVIIDPVLVNHKQQPMFPDAVRQAYLEQLLPLATMVTPNVTEAALLAEMDALDSLEAVKAAAARLHQAGAKHVLIKRFVTDGASMDVLYDGTKFYELREPLIETENTHGSGDTLSAAICTFLARGDRVKTAVSQAKAFTTGAIKRAADWQLGAGHGPVDNIARVKSEK